MRKTNRAHFKSWCLTARVTSHLTAKGRQDVCRTYEVKSKGICENNLHCTPVDISAKHKERTLTKISEDCNSLAVNTALLYEEQILCQQHFPADERRNTMTLQRDRRPPTTSLPNIFLWILHITNCIS